MASARPHFLIDSFLHPKNPLVISSLLHAFAIATFFCLNSYHFGESNNVNIEVYEQPKLAPVPLELAAPKQQIQKPAISARKVFGVSRKALLEEGSSVSEKAGNTLATAPDDKKLADGDHDLPIPTDDYLVEAMPILKDEVRVAYPKEAKEKSIEGPVVMDILIDQEGVVRQANVVSGPGFGLNEAASLAIQKFHFVPAKVKAQNVAVRIRYTYRFILEK